VSEPLPQFGEAEVKAMTSEQIVAANRAGQLGGYLGVTKPSPEEQTEAERIAKERAVVHGGISVDAARVAGVGEG
jgi:hypothetical protein